jgi:hypothetical protein
MGVSGRQKKKMYRKETNIGGGEGEGVSVEGGVRLCGVSDQKERKRRKERGEYYSEADMREREK